MSIGLGIGLVVLTVALVGVVFWLASGAQAAPPCDPYEGDE